MSTFHLRLLVLTYLALAGGALLVWAVRSPTRPSARLGMRGRNRQRALLRSALWSRVEPALRWLGLRLAPLLSTELRATLDRHLTRAGDPLGIVAEEYAALFVCAAALGVGASVALRRMAGIHWVLPLLPLFFAAVPVLQVERARELRMRCIHRKLPYVIDLLSLAMSAGLDFPGALRRIVETSAKDDAMHDELLFLLQQLELGRTRADALRELQRRTESEAVAAFTQALIQSEERGNPVSATLVLQATAARQRRTHLAEKAAQDMKAKMVFPTMILVAIGLLLIMIPSAKMMERLLGASR